MENQASSESDCKYPLHYALYKCQEKYLTLQKSCSMISKVMTSGTICTADFIIRFLWELLTEHQRRIYEDVVLNDYSLSEVAADLGISRQGVHDNVKRCNKILSDYEEKLHLVEKFVNIKEKSTGFTVL